MINKIVTIIKEEQILQLSGLAGLFTCLVMAIIGWQIDKRWHVSLESNGALYMALLMAPGVVIAGIVGICMISYRLKHLTRQR